MGTEAGSHRAIMRGAAVTGVLTPEGPLSALPHRRRERSCGAAGSLGAPPAAAAPFTFPPTVTAASSPTPVIPCGFRPGGGVVFSP